MKKFLAIETSSSTGSWALFEKGECTATESFSGRASASLIPSLLPVRDSLRDVEEIVVGVGPGSFGGVRVGIAAAQGLAAVWNCPITPCLSSDAVGWDHAAASYLGVFADAKRGHWFFTAYEHGRLHHAPRLIRLDEIEFFLSKCTLTASPEPLPPVALTWTPTARALGSAWLKNGAAPGLALEPVYLHEAVAGA